MNDYELFPGAIVFHSSLKTASKIICICGNDPFCTIEHLSDPEEASSQFRMRVDRLEPIFITPDWCRKLNLEWLEKPQCFRIKDSLMLDFDNLAEDNQGCVLHIDHINFVSNILYVHQLQGLYAHLTGKLLTIKL